MIRLKLPRQIYGVAIVIFALPKISRVPGFKDVFNEFIVLKNYP